MILEYDGNTFKIELNELNVSLKLSLKNESISANTSGSDTINKGTKPKSIYVSGVVKFEDEDHLKELVKLAEKTDESGIRQIYTINDKTAEIGDVRQVQFNNDFNVKKMAKFEAWNVDFSLLQKNSVAEAKENKTKPKEEPVADSITGEAVVAEQEQVTEQAMVESRGFIWEALKKLDEYLEPEGANNENNKTT
ncbi:conserved hypothetical protein [Oleispira antarctica RB-8]|uniref:Uncharacterized protein n=1 Tax=Oleispira antarctica RB-8 TaxID=698738 RepID=R4YKI7_OLEAN|nr:conserved hypothetical protein [Oleispira antarctica RB-8]